MKSKDYKKLGYILTFILILNACGSPDEDLRLGGAGGDSNEWLIPKDQVLDGGPGKDGIPALNEPEMITKEQAEYLDDSDLVIGYINGSDVRAYPHKILDWHEIINDKVNDHPVAITYCPLTGTAIGWEREYKGNITTFGVSGLLYQTNLMPYDRVTNSTWSQMRLQSVNGQLIGTEANLFQVFETTWGTWKSFYPNTTVVSTNTGHSRNYARYPYGDYKTSENLLFSVSVKDQRLPAKERVLGIISDESVKVYQYSNFITNPILIDNFRGVNYVVVGSKEENFIISFEEKIINGEPLVFQPTDLYNTTGRFSSPQILIDQFGNTWDIFGKAISGPNEGESMVPAKSFIGFWFSWAPFYRNPEIF